MKGERRPAKNAFRTATENASSEHGRASAPAFVIAISLEDKPRVSCDALTESDELRLRGWLARRPDLQRIIDLAASYGDAA